MKAVTRISQMTTLEHRIEKRIKRLQGRADSLKFAAARLREKELGKELSAMAKKKTDWLINQANIAMGEKVS